MVDEHREGRNETKETGPKGGWLWFFVEPALEVLGEAIIRAQGHEPGFLDYLAEHHEEEINSSFKRASELSKTARPQNAKENWQATFEGLKSLSTDYRRLQIKYDIETKERRLRALVDREQREAELKSDEERIKLFEEQIKKHERN